MRRALVEAEGSLEPPALVQRVAKLKVPFDGRTPDLQRGKELRLNRVRVVLLRLHEADARPQLVGGA